MYSSQEQLVLAKNRKHELHHRWTGIDRISFQHRRFREVVMEAFTSSQANKYDSNSHVFNNNNNNNSSMDFRGRSEPTTKNCQEALFEVLESVQNRDVYNFLFTSERIELASFEDPNIVRTAIAATFSSKRSYAEHVEQVQGHMLYVPCFTISNLHLGFGYHYHTPIGNDSIGKVKRGHARYVLDCERRSFVTVLSGDEGSFLISYKKFLSTSCHRRYTICFRRRPVENGCFEDWFREVSYMYSGLEFRECVYCKKLGCDCEFIDQQSEHPFDDSGFREGVNGMMGSFNGVGRVESLNEGVLKQVFMGECEMRLSVCDDTGVIEELRLLACGADLGVNNNGKRMVSEIKKELRKERNRASARKSNMKKKLLNDGLKLEIENEKQRVGLLRDVEEKLRLRNLELRRLLAEEGMRRMDT